MTGLRFYEKWNGGLRTIGEVWHPEPHKDLSRAIKTPEKFDEAKGWERVETMKDRLVEVRAIVASQPRLARTGKKEPDLFEVKIDGGTLEERMELGRRLLGKEVKVSDVFREGGEVDVVAITKGKGIQEIGRAHV